MPGRKGLRWVTIQGRRRRRQKVPRLSFEILTSELLAMLLSRPFHFTMVLLASMRDDQTEALQKQRNAE